MTRSFFHIEPSSIPTPPPETSGPDTMELDSIAELAHRTDSERMNPVVPQREESWQDTQQEETASLLYTDTYTDIYTDTTTAPEPTPAPAAEPDPQETAQPQRPGDGLSFFRVD